MPMSNWQNVSCYDVAKDLSFYMRTTKLHTSSHYNGKSIVICPVMVDKLKFVSQIKSTLFPDQDVNKINNNQSLT